MDDWKNEKRFMEEGNIVLLPVFNLTSIITMQCRKLKSPIKFSKCKFSFSVIEHR